MKEMEGASRWGKGRGALRWFRIPSKNQNLEVKKIGVHCWNMVTAYLFFFFNFWGRREEDARYGRFLLPWTFGFIWWSGRRRTARWSEMKASIGHNSGCGNEKMKAAGWGRVALWERKGSQAAVQTEWVSDGCRRRRLAEARPGYKKRSEKLKTSFDWGENAPKYNFVNKI